MDLKQKKQGLEAASFFQEWKQKHSTAYLAHFFIISDTEVQLGYYEPSADTIWTFTSGITNIAEDKEIFKEQKTIPELDMSKINISVEQAKQKAQEYQKEKYPSDPISKDIIVLQTLDNKAAYNMTLITLTFKMLNVRIDAENGNIISEKMQPIMNMVQTFESKKK
ncbi:PepSY domain-containing protein [Candidatus Woesearchaeota archaeon]|nr:PepSY domain-containing protein [Candidatus Woesearchaeota archaeon]